MVGPTFGVKKLFIQDDIHIYIDEAKVGYNSGIHPMQAWSLQALAVAFWIPCFLSCCGANAVLEANPLDVHPDG